MRPVDPAAIRRVLFVRPRYLGDICLTLPSVDAVRAACPGAEIGYVLERALAPLLEGDERFAALFPVPPRPGTGETLALVRSLRAWQPDVVIDCFCNPRTALWSGSSGAPVRVGYANKGWRSLLYTHHARPRTLSATGFHLASVAALGWRVPAQPSTPRLRVGEAARAAAREALRALGVPGDAALLGLHPGARWPTRRWDARRYAELAGRALARDPGLVALFTAGPGEEPLARACAEGLPKGRAFVVAGWPLASLVGLQSLCAAFVCGDTGPLHTAVAAGAPTLGLMSRNRPAMFFPYAGSEGHRAYTARVECSPCHRDECDDLRCLARLTVEGAWNLLAPMLNAAAAAGAPSTRA